MDDLMQDFLSETTELLEELTTEVVAWENNPSDRERLDAIFRCVHTIKGSSSFLNLPRIGRLAHAAEDALDGVRTRKLGITRPLVTAILSIVDRLTSITGAILDDGAEPEGNDRSLLANLEAATTAALVGSGPVHAVPGSVDGAAIERNIRIPLGLIDRLMSGVSDMVLARNEVSRHFRDGERSPELTNAFDRLSARIAETRMLVSHMRMQRIERLFSALPRTVRDLSGKLDKSVDLTIEGNDVEIDREMIDVIRDPLLHIVRNAIDHGIEDRAGRIAAGKPETARVAISARQSGNQILIEFSDDGRGIAVDRVLSRAVERGIIRSADIAGMNDKEKLKLIFRPGFSTATKVTDVSGRGVGMDVVRANVERIGGIVELENHEGRGLTVRLRVPMTLTIVSALTLAISDHNFAIPRGNVVEILLETNANVRIARAGGADFVHLRGKPLALVYLDRLLGIRAECDSDQPEECTLIIVRPASGKPYAMRVDDVIDQEELVIRPAAPQIMGTGFYGGVTLPDNGRPMLLLDPSGIAETAEIFELDETLSISTDAAAEPAPVEDKGKILLLQELDGTTRAIALEVVERVEEIDAATIVYAGNKWRASVHGESIPVYPNHVETMQGPVKLLRVSDGQQAVGYPVVDVIDIIDMPDDIAPSPFDSLIAGVATVNDEAVELVDPHWLFFESDRDAALDQGARRPLCRLDYANRQWARQFLAPIIESVGYEVVFGEERPEAAADLLIVDAEANLPSKEAFAGRIVRLRSQASRISDQDDSIYRYDRPGLLRALRHNDGVGR